MTDIEIEMQLFVEWWDARNPERQFESFDDKAKERVLDEHKLFFAGVAYGRAFADADPARVAELKAGA